MKKLILLAAIAATGMTASAQDVYIIGGNVNGQSWALAAPDAKMESLGDGVFEWKGEVLGSNFKFNDGTWDNGMFEGTEVIANIGSNGDVLEVGEDNQYYYNTGGETKDIVMDEMEVKNPTVTLNLNEGWITVVGEAAEVVMTYYLPGSYNANEWQLNDECMFTEENGKYVIKGMNFEKAGEFKVATQGWMVGYGSPKAEVEEGSEEPAGPAIVVSADALNATLVKGADNAAIDLSGSYDVEFTISDDTENVMIVFSASDPNAVAGIDAENAPVYYYNLQGVRVENPSNGIFVKVVGEKAAKVLFNN